MGDQFCREIWDLSSRDGYDYLCLTCVFYIMCLLAVCLFHEYLLPLFSFILISGVIGCIYLMDLSCWFCSWIGYVIAFWCFSSHNEDIIEFWCGSEVPICIYF